MALVFQQRGKMSPWMMVGFFLAFPCLMLLFLMARQHGTERLRVIIHERESDVVKFLQEIIDQFRLIADYGQKPMSVTMFHDKIAATNQSITNALLFETINQEFAPFLTSLFTGIYILASYQYVLDGGPIGAFCSGIATWRFIGGCYENIYNDFLKIHEEMAALRTVSFYMNLPLDVGARMELHRVLLKEGEEEWQAARSKLTVNGIKTGNAYALDLLFFRCRNLAFSYPKFTGGTRVFESASFEFPLGKLVAITGPRGGGNATLLNLLGGVLLPPMHSPLHLFVPPHLRVLHVAREAQILPALNTFDNLCFGPSDGADESPQRVVTICRRLGVSSKVLAMIEKEANAADDNGTSSMEISQAQSQHQIMKQAGDSVGASLMSRGDAMEMSHTDRSLLHLARAFVMNAEVMVLHKPLSNFDDLHSRLVVELLREFVALRGIEESYETFATRRPRTCIFSTDSSNDTHGVCDLTLYIGNGTVEVLHQEEIQQLRVAVRRFFTAIDVDGDNNVSLVEFAKAIRTQQWFGTLLGLEEKQMSGTTEELENALGEIFAAVDYSSNGEVDFEELAEYLRSQFEDDMPRVLKALESYNDASKGARKGSKQTGSSGAMPWDVPEVPKEQALPMQSLSLA